MTDEIGPIWDLADMLSGKLQRCREEVEVRDRRIRRLWKELDEARPAVPPQREGDYL